MAPAENPQRRPLSTPSFDELLADLPLLAWQSGPDPRQRSFAPRWDFLPSLAGSHWMEHIHRPQRIDVEERLRQAGVERQSFSLQYEFITASGPQRILDRGCPTPEGFMGLWIDLESSVHSRRDLLERIHELSQPLTVALHWLQGSRRRIRRGHPAEAEDIEAAIDRALAELERAVRMLSAWREGR